MTCISLSVDSALHLEDYVMDAYFGIMSQGDAVDDLIINVGLCFKVHWFCFISLWEFHGWMSYFGTVSQCDATTDHIIDVCHGDLYFTLSSEFSSYFEDNTMDSCLALWLCPCDAFFDLEITINLDDPYSMVQWFYPTSWRLFDGWTSYIEIMGRCDTKFYLILNVGHGDLDFMFHLILLYILKSVKWMNPLSHCNAVVDRIINVGHCDLYFMIQWFCLKIVFFFCIQNILVLLAKRDSGELQQLLL